MCRDYRILYVDVSFHNTTKFFKNITLHIKLKNPPHRAGLQTSIIIRSSPTCLRKKMVNGTNTMSMLWTRPSTCNTHARARPVKGKSPLVANYLIIDLLGYSDSTP
jgi:hypothetical protein